MAEQPVNETDGDEQFIPTNAPEVSEVVSPVCGARLRNKPGRFCQRACSIGRTRCKLHGGATLRGTESKTYKHGLYSRVLPKGLRKDFDSLMGDPNLLEGRAEVSLLQVRLARLTARLGTNESSTAWATLQGLMQQFQTANAAGDADGQVNALTSMGALIDGQVSDEQAWREVTEFVEQATKIAEREWKRVVANRTVATADQVRLIVQSLTDAVLTHVTDSQTRRAISEHVNRLRIIPAIPLSG